MPANISMRWSRWADQEKTDEEGWRGPCTVTGEGGVIVAAGRGDKQNQRAHDDLRAGGCRAAERQPGWRRPDQWAWASSHDGSGDGHHDVQGGDGGAEKRGQGQ